MSFHQPSVWFLLALIVLPVVWSRWSVHQRRRAVGYSSLQLVRRVPASWAARLAWVVPALRSVVLAVLVVAIARPQKADEQTRVFTEGIAIQLVVDKSGSMDTDDYRIMGRPTTRLEAVKRVVSEFVGGGDELEGRPNDLVGVVAFATYAEAICPLTLDHEHVLRVVESIEIPRIDAEQSTAIGDGIALGLEHVRQLDEAVFEETAHRIRGKVMILLTDGENQAGEIDPRVAAEMAQALDVRIYTIGAGSDMDLSARVDERLLRTVAEMTGGEYFRATNSTALREVYARIDELERSEIRERRFVDYHEAALSATRLGPITVPPLLGVAFALLLVETLLATTRLRRLV